MSNFSWDLYGHPKNQKLKTVVGYTKFNNHANHVHIMVPLYDLRDDNKDGVYGWLEAAWRWVPGVGGLLDPMAEVELMTHIAMHYRDGDMLQKAREKAIAEAFKAASTALMKSALNNAVGPAIKIAVNRYSLNLFEHYVIKKGSESLLGKLLSTTIS